MADDQAAPRQFEAGARVKVFAGDQILDGECNQRSYLFNGIHMVYVKFDGNALPEHRLCRNVYQLPRDRDAFVRQFEAVIAYMQGQIEEVGNE